MSAASMTLAPTGPLAQASRQALAGVVVPAAELVQVSKHYALGQTDVTALYGVNLSIEAGSFTVISGPSGSGKTTLLNVLGCLHQPTHGKVYIGDEDGDIAIFNLSSDPEVAMDDEQPISEVNVGNAVYSSPVVANDTLYIANKSTIFAIAAE